MVGERGLPLLSTDPLHKRVFSFISSTQGNLSLPFPQPPLPRGFEGGGGLSNTRENLIQGENLIQEESRL